MTDNHKAQPAQASKAHTDLTAKPRLIPLAAWPYIQLGRFERLIGSYLLFWPCLWGMALALMHKHKSASTSYDAAPILLLPSLVDLLILALVFLSGAILMRGAGCAVNDFFDRKIDAQVARTASRPLASGKIKPRSALYFIALLCTLSLLLMLAALGLGIMNVSAIITAFFILPLAAFYPLAKRVTRWPQLVLGLAFNWGVFVGYAALLTPLSGAQGLSLFALYISGVLWTIGYDTIYAHQDREDDALLGLGSTALLFGKHSKALITLFYSAQLAMLATALWFSGLKGEQIKIFALILPLAIQLYWQVLRLDIHNPQGCLQLFRSNNLAGAMIAALLFIAAFIA